MKLFHIVGMAKNRVIGKDNALPWHFPEDLQHFKKTTAGSTVIMGRKTFESIGRPLPNRENFVLSRSRQTPKEGIHFFTSLEEALRQVKTEMCFIIGGAHLYAQTLERVDGIYASFIDQAVEGDAYYPEIPDFFREKTRTLLRQDPKIEVIYFENIREVNR